MDTMTSNPTIIKLFSHVDVLMQQIEATQCTIMDMVRELEQTVMTIRSAELIESVDWTKGPEE
jgi:hypothetical protein